MSGHLWKSFLEDDVLAFRAVLGTAGYSTRGGTYRAGGAGQTVGLGIASPGSFSRKASDWLHSPAGAVHDSLSSSVPAGLVLTRADLNHRDSQGRTLLHLAAASTSDTAFEFANALLEHPLTDIYMQDLENGWTPLHRAFYQGNLAIAHAILARDFQDAIGSGAGTHHAGGLIKIKDHEGNGPFDLLEMTFDDRGPSHRENLATSLTLSDSDDDAPGSMQAVGASLSSDFPLGLQGDEVYTFGSNKNITLGFGDEDDRQYPERILLRRPGHLFHRLLRRTSHKHHQHSYQQQYDSLPHDEDRPLSPRSDSALDSEIPFSILSKPIIIRDVYMSKFSTAILTEDPVSNLHICGHGSGGRLGLGDETTRFLFTCVEVGSLAQKKVVSVALGQNHTLALSSSGEVFSWGNNSVGQLGYTLPKTSTRNEEPVQLSPRQIFGPLKRETISGIAASGIHSVVYNGYSLFTFGKNEGQLGIVDSDARSLEVQPIPRRVAASSFHSPIVSVSAIDRATTCLLENHDVWVFANYGYAKLIFPLDDFSNYFHRSTFRTTRYDWTSNHVCKIASGGDTIGVLSRSGEIFTVSVSRPNVTAQEVTSSTTNPTKIRSALSQPVKVWSNKKTHMAACDVDVDQSGSIALVTQAGSVWRRVKRANIKDATASGTGDYKPKDYKFSRISGLTQVAAVRASGFGAYAAVRKDISCLDRISKSPPKSRLGDAVLSISPFKAIANSSARVEILNHLYQKIPLSEDPDSEVQEMLRNVTLGGSVGQDLLLASNTSPTAIPIYQFVISAGSRIIYQALKEFHTSGSCAIPDLLTLSTDKDTGLPKITFQCLDVLTLLNLVTYLFSGTVVDFWRPKTPKSMAFRHRQSRTELLRLASLLEMPSLETTVKRGSGDDHALDIYFAENSAHYTELPGANVTIRLADGEVKVHAALMCERCPFFEGLFQGRAGGRWLSDRINSEDKIQVDLHHIRHWVFDRVLMWVYADQTVGLFDEVVAEDLDEFLDDIIDVLGTANELMMEDLAKSCQLVIASYVNVRNVCHILNAVAPCSVTLLKNACLEYICLNLEAVLRNGQLDELDEDLLPELDDAARSRQKNLSLISRTGYAEEELLRKYPNLERKIEQERKSKIDSIHLLNKYSDMDTKGSSSFRAGSFHELYESSLLTKTRRRSSNHGANGSPSPMNSPALKEKRSVSDLIFDMDDEEKPEEKLQSSGDKPSPLPSPAHAFAESPWQNVQRRRTSFNNQQDINTTSPRSSSKPDVRSSPIPNKSGSPWAPINPLSSTKLHMRDIMEQASSPCTSNLSLSLSAKAPTDHKPSASFSTGKLSQKERKKLQQQGNDQILPVSPGLGLGSSSEPKSSPWQTTPAKHKNKVSESPTSVCQGQDRSKSQLTMRQTIANPGSPAKGKTASTSASQPNPSTSSPDNRRLNPTPASQSTSVSPSASQTPSPSQPRIQSIRHTPLPSRSSVSMQSLSMADILLQQQAEKVAVREAVAKRSLMDIQAEQEFQEWWDKESARVKEEEEEEEKKRAASKRSSGGVRRRGGGSSKGRVGSSNDRPDGNGKAAVK